MDTTYLIKGKILNSLVKFSLPVFLALFLQAMYGAVDLLVVGKFSGTADQSGVATGSQLVHMVTMIVAGLSMGVTVLVGEAIGAEKHEEVSRGIGTGIIVFLILAAVLTAIIAPLSEVLAVLLNAPQEALQATSVYILICGLGTVFIVAYNVLGAIFRGLGDSTTPLITVAIACVINIGGDLLFVAAFGMGAAGAALATIISQAISVVISILIIRKKKLPFGFSKKDLVPDKHAVKKILFVGSPIALQEMLVQLSFIIVQSVVNSLGLIASAGIGVAEKCCAFLMLTASAFMQAISAFVAQNNGAGQPERSKKALFYGMATALAAGLVMGLIAFFGGSLLGKIFSDDGAVILAAHAYLKAYAIDCLFTAILFCMIGYFNGCEKTIFVMLQGIVGSCALRIPLVYLMKSIANGNLFIIGLSTPMSSVIQIIMCIVAFIVYENKRKKIESAKSKNLSENDSISTGEL